MATPAENTWLQLLEIIQQTNLARLVGRKVGFVTIPDHTAAAYVIRNFAATVFLPAFNLATVGTIVMDASDPDVGSFRSMFVSEVMNLSRTEILDSYGRHSDSDADGEQLEQDLVTGGYLESWQTLNPNDDLFPSSAPVGADFLAFDSSTADDGGSGSVNETDETAFKSGDHDYGFKELRKMLNESPATTSLSSRASSPLDAMVNNQSALLAQCLASCTSVGSAETNIFPPQENQQPLVVAVASNQF